MHDEPVGVNRPPGESERDRNTAVRLLGLQVFLTGLSGLALWWFSPAAAIALLAGGMIGAAGNGWMVLSLFRPRAACSPQQLLWSLYLGELGKFLFVMAFFAIAFRQVAIFQQPACALLMLLAFAATQVLHWLWPLMSRNK